jgi:2,3-bisphosphoglycerate-independent phosphoglycerate mutase
VNKKVLLVILDGWGIAEKGYEDRSAIIAAKTPFYDSLIANYPHSTLVTFGPEVGLPEGQFGNSEVGHMNLGAGRTVRQSLVRLNESIETDMLRHEPVLVDAIKYAKENDKPFHLMGLVSDGGVHAHISHVKALCNVLKDNGLNKVFIHAFTDGRDCDPKSGAGFIGDLQSFLRTSTGKIASVTGRYYAMDRDNRWERIEEAYDVMVKGEGVPVCDEGIVALMKDSYAAGITDEFIKPIVVTKNNQPIGNIQEGDVVLCFNYRTDRPQEITKALTQEDFPENGMKKLDIRYLTMTNYNKSFTNVNVIFDDSNLPSTLGEIVDNAGKTQCRVAETEKFPHVTFFFSGGRNDTFPKESRLLAISPKVATYDLQPEMSVIGVEKKVTETAIEELKSDFICLNFANPDMVGHTGNFQAVIKACEAVDNSLKAVVNKAKDYMINDDGTPNTQHSMNLVPCILIDKDYKSIKNGKLGDISPTILELMGIEKPAIMTGFSLI